MAHFDIFASDPFSLTSMTLAVRAVPHIPTFLGDLGLFTPKPVTTRTVTVEKVAGKLALIQTSEPGAPVIQVTRNRRNLRMFRTDRLALGDRVTADEIQGMREFGTDSTLTTVQAEVARRLVPLSNNMDLTFENMRMGAIQGIVLDADGSQIYNYFTEFGVSQANEIDFELDDSTTDVRGKCQLVTRAMIIASAGAWLPTTTCHAICGATFYDDLINHPSVRATYLGWSAAAELRGETLFGSFPFGGVVFHEYRGTDDGTTIAVSDEKALFFPVGARDVFQVAYSPHASFPFVNTPGQERYAMTVMDNDRQMYVDLEVYSYPLFLCALPEILQRAKHH